MNPLTIFAIGFFGIGMLLLGIYAGEQNIIRKDHTANRIRSQDDSKVWWMIGVVAIVAAIVIAIVAANPAESFLKYADQIRSVITTETR